MIIDGFVHQLPDADPEETGEWLDALGQIIDEGGEGRARFLMARLIEYARSRNIGVPASVSTPYINTIPPEQEAWFPGDEKLEQRIRRIIRWNAAVMVVRANKAAEAIGGHLSTFASSATLYEVGFNHFFRGKEDGRPGDHVYIQGHAAPGIYARAFLEHRLEEAQLDRFRREIGGGGLSSYPHPRLMPGFWEYPTVSMGLGPINSIYQARFNRYLHHRRLDDTADSRVWCFLGDGEVDEPETLGSISLAARERLDNLTWVVNCNLQRLDGPVRGNGKIIQELEAIFRGAGWHVIKVIWGANWDPLLARDADGVLVEKMNRTVDGEYQRFKAEDGAYVREHFFGPDPRLRRMVAHLTDDEIWALRRGGHDYRKMYAAYRAAVELRGAPVVILAKTIKGWTLGPDVEGRNATHQIKKLSNDQLLVLARSAPAAGGDPRRGPGEGAEPPYYRPPLDSPEVQYLLERRRALDGPLPSRPVELRRPLTLPGHAPFAEFDAGSGSPGGVDHDGVHPPAAQPGRAHEGFGPRVVPIIPDEGRTFGMDALFKELRIYASEGQRYEPVDHHLLLSYKESQRRPDPRGGHHRSGCDGLVDRRRPLSHATRRGAHGAVLHLLLDVRVPASGRPDLAGRRRPGPRFPAGGHGRANHPAGRRPAAPGRAQPPARLHRAGVPCLRPGLCLRDGDHRGARLACDVRPRPRGCLLLPDPVQRELPHAAEAAGGGPGHPRRPLSLGPGSRGRRPPGRHPLLRAGPPGGPPGPSRPGRALRRRSGVVERHLLQGRSARRHSRSSAGTACTPPRSPESRSSPGPWPKWAGPWWRSPTS